MPESRKVVREVFADEDAQAIINAMKTEALDELLEGFDRQIARHETMLQDAKDRKGMILDALLDREDWRPF